jgi:hypothetical protein
LKALFCTLFTISLSIVPAWATVVVTNPTNGETVPTSANYVATASASTCSKGVASIGVYVDGALVQVVNSSQINIMVSLSIGSHKTVVQEWDNCGGSTYTPIAVTVANQSGVWVTSPSPNSTVNVAANFVATATSSCSKGVASMGVYVAGKLVYTVQGAKLNTQLTLNPGAQQTVVQEWDSCGGSTYSTINLTVTNSVTKLTNLQANGTWDSWGQLPPAYVDCSPCSGLSWSSAKGISSPSKSGNATQFSTSGSTPWGAVLWYNPVIGTYSTQNLPDVNHTLVPSLHNFIYDADFYLTNPAANQALEFDVSMYVNGIGMFFGTQCNHLGGGEWDVLNNVTQQWSPTPIACPLLTGWNHVTLNFQRESDNSLLYQSVTLNGVTSNINERFSPFTVPVSWYGITFNYQMDGDKHQTANTTYLDNANLTYW